MYVSDSKSGSEGIIIISDCNSCNISSLDKYFLTLLLLPLPYSSYSLLFFVVVVIRMRKYIYIYFRVSFSLKEYPILIKFHFILTPFPPSNIEHRTLNGLWSSIQWIKSWTWDRNYIHKFIFFVYRSELFVQVFLSSLYILSSSSSYSLSLRCKVNATLHNRSFFLKCHTHSRLM